jgi:hypothetical protein
VGCAPPRSSAAARHGARMNIPRARAATARAVPKPCLALSNALTCSAAQARSRPAWWSSTRCTCWAARCT